MYINSTASLTKSQARKPRKQAFEYDGSQFAGHATACESTIDTTLDPPDYAESPYCQEHLVPFSQWLMQRHQKLGGVTEIRVIADKPAKMIWSGYFDPGHIDELVKQIEPDSDGPRKKIPYGETARIGEAQFYFTMQPANPDLLAQSANELSRCQATSDGDTIAYTLFGADLDPERPAGISATDEEKAEARKVADKVGKSFKQRGIAFILADSGNGCHLLVPTIAYEDVKQASDNAHTLLQLLDKQFTTDKVKIDTTIYNPSRILKLYGTKAVKGSNVPDRPHRYATIDLKKIPADVDLFKLVAKELDDFRAAAQPAKKETTTAKTTTAKVKAATTVGGDGWDAATSNKVMKAVLEKLGLPFRIKDKAKGQHYAFEDCPYHTDPDEHHYECCVIVRPNGSFAAKCQHESKAGWKDFKPLIRWDENIGAVLDELGIKRRTGPYKMTDTGIVHRKKTKDGTVEVPLTNFTAKIVADIAEDDGVETRRTFEIEARLHGRTHRFTVPAQDFASMNWAMANLGASGVVSAGQGTKDHTRAAIQSLSGDVPIQKVYTHLGWRKHAGQWVYLHAGGAMGPKGNVEGVRVQMSEPFTRFGLSNRGTKDELVQAVKASLKLLELAPDSITVPLFAGIWRAAAGGTDFSQHLVGPTGNFKTELAFLIQQHWARN